MNLCQECSGADYVVSLLVGGTCQVLIFGEDGFFVDVLVHSISYTIVIIVLLPMMDMVRAHIRMHGCTHAHAHACMTHKHTDAHAYTHMPTRTVGFMQNQYFEACAVCMC